MLIAQISDTHILAKSSDEAVGVDRAENLQQCVAGINRQGVDVVVHTGDMVHHGAAEQYSHLREILDGLEAPLYVIPGNRDRHDALRAAFDDAAYLPKSGEFLHYVIEHHPVRLIALDSITAGERKGVFCARRRAWLEETLAHEPKRATLLFMHHPPFDIAPHYVDGYRHPQDAVDLAAAVKRHPQVARLLCGHLHCTHREPWGGTDATTMPSVALDLRKGYAGPVEAGPSYVLHIASAEGDVVSHARLA